MYTVDNAVIMAAGASSRFAPLSFERPKALIEVRGEILIERQIKQLHEVGISDVHIVVGYKAEQFDYLREKFGVNIIRNDEYLTRNNHSSIYAARKVIRNTYICSADNYFTRNPFEKNVDENYYAALYAQGNTNEWCMQTDGDGYICSVDVGGCDSWYMLGHVFWSEAFSRTFLNILEAVYQAPETRNLFWEDIFAKNLSVLKMRLRKYSSDFIFEFDSLDELRMFDPSYVSDTRSIILKQLAAQMGGTEADFREIRGVKGAAAEARGFQFRFKDKDYEYDYTDRKLKEIL